MAEAEKDKQKKSEESQTGKPKDDKTKEADAAKGEKSEGKFKIFLDSLTARERTIAMGAVFVISAVIIDSIVVRPIMRNLDRLNLRITEAETIIPKRLMILRHGNKIKRDNQKLHPYMTDSGMSREEEIAQLLRDIERVSNESGLFISNINPVQVAEDRDGRYTLLVDIEGKGMIEHIRSYISLLEISNPAIRVGSFSLRAKKKGSEELSYAMTIIKLGVTSS